MSESPRLAERDLTAAEQAIALRCVLRARESGQARWLARVIEAEVGDVLRCYAHAGVRDRFFWQRVEVGEAFCTFGAVDEIESDGPGRFSDIRDWTRKLRQRIDWLGPLRPATAPLFVGGFGFESEMAVSPDWKAFPAARFVLPEVIVEQRDGQSRWILFVRVESGATQHAVVSELEARFDDAAAANAPGEIASDGASARSGIDSTEELDGAVGRTLDGCAGEAKGPEYIVRADRSHAKFQEQIRNALGDIEEGRMAKVVVARSLSVDHDSPFDIPSFLDRLRSMYPSCTLVAVGRAMDTFLAATPETLIRIAGDEVASAALAGSAPRGRHPEEDEALGQALLGSEKENAEHNHVVASIRSAIESCCEEFEISETPTLRKLVGIQHLETCLRGRLSSKPDGQPAVDLLELVETLHPTPAVGGVPAENAASWLRRFEGLDRGWYAAPIGWLDPSGGGDFRVALRSALIRNGLGPEGSSGASRALLFAGAGIVAGSDPAQELVETRIKLRALLAPMTEI